MIDHSLARLPRDEAATLARPPGDRECRPKRRRSATASPRGLTRLVGGCAIGTAVAWNIANTGAIAGRLAHHYGTGLAGIGLFTSLLFVGELLVMLSGGKVVDRYGAKRSGVAAIVISVLANLLLLLGTRNIYVALALRTLAGVSLGLGFLAGAIYVQLDPRLNPLLASGIFGGVALGASGLALAVVPQLVGLFGWRAPYVSGAVVAGALLLLASVCPATPAGGERQAQPRLLTLLRDGRLVRIGAVGTVSFGFSVLVGNWVVTLLERNARYQSATAAAIGALVLLLPAISRPLGGLLAQLRPRATWPVVAVTFPIGAVATFTLAFSSSVPLDYIAAALVGLSAGMPFGATIVGSARAYPLASGAAIGAMNSYAILTTVLGAPLLGLSFDLPGSGKIGFVVLAALWLAALAFIPHKTRLD